MEPYGSSGSSADSPPASRSGSSSATSPDPNTGTYLVLQLRRNLLARSLRGTAPVAGGMRGEISSLSKASSRRLRRFLQESKARWSAFLTLTLPAGTYPAPKVKAWFRRFLRLLRERLTEDFGKQWTVVWVIEHTKAGTPHFHLVSSGFVPRVWLSDAWWHACGNLSPEHRKAGTQVEAVRDQTKTGTYLCKYLTKSATNRPEKRAWSGKCWGVIGDRSLVGAPTVRLTLADCQNPTIAMLLERIESSSAFEALSEWHYGSATVRVLNQERAEGYGRLITGLAGLVELQQARRRVEERAWQEKRL